MAATGDRGWYAAAPRGGAARGCGTGHRATILAAEVAGGVGRLLGVNQIEVSRREARALPELRASWESQRVAKDWRRHRRAD